MTTDPVTQERIYRALKGSLLSGAYSAGARLEIPSIARLYDASPTPVREALGRLVGEGLVEHREEGGYRWLLPDAGSLRDLYFWNAQHLLSALHVVSEGAVVRVLEPLQRKPAATSVSQQVTLIGRIFEAIGDCTGNDEFSKRIRNVNERLHAVRIAEGELFKDIGEEATRMLALGRFNVQKNVRRKIMSYHRRRIDRVGEITASLSR